MRHGGVFLVAAMPRYVALGKFMAEERFWFFVWFTSDYVKYTGKQEKQNYRIEAVEK